MTDSPQPHDRLRRITSYASVGIAATLIFAKAIAYTQTWSVALLSSLLDSSMDMAASLITAYGIAHALRPADKDHRFGHGKAESLSALIQSAFITGASILLLVEAIERFAHPVTLKALESGYIVMGLAIVLTALLLALQTYTIRKTRSMAIASDRLHYLGDILINLAVIATFALQEHFDILWIDPVFAVLIAASMLWGAYKIGRNALDVLMDAELPEEDRSRILSIASNVQGVLGVHDLRTRSDSGRAIIEIHVEMEDTLSLRAAHDIAEEVEEAIKQAFPGADVLTHQDPKGIVEQRLDIAIEKQSP